MNPKIVIVLTFCLIQTIGGDTIGEVIAELTPQIAAVRSKINTVIENGRTLIRQTYREIGQEVTQAEITIQGQMDQLDNIVQEADQEASEKFEDISECVKPVNDFVPEIGELDNCTKNHDLNLLGADFGELGILKRNLSSSINTCLRQSPRDSEGFKTCVQSIIENCQSRSDQVEGELGRVCEEAKKTSISCVESSTTRLDHEISAVAHDLKNCLLNTL